MDHDDLREATRVPSQATFSNNTIILSAKTLSTISEQDSKQDLSFNGNKEEIENECRITEKSKITPLSSTDQKLNHDISHPSFRSNKRLNHALCENEKKFHDQVNKKISQENTCSQICPDINNASRAPFIELGAAHKILDFITNSDFEVSSLTNNYCNEISRILQCLLAQRNDERLEDFLLKDSSLYRCECCGVISYIPELCSVIKELKENSTKTRTRDAEITTAERDCINNDRNKKELKISINLPDLKNNTQSGISVGDSKADCRAVYKDELNEIESLPIKKRAMRGCIGNPNEVNNISDTETDVNIKFKHKSHFNNNTIKRLFADFEAKKDKKYDYNSIMRSNNLNSESSTMKVYADIDKEEIVREISYERKSQIDDMLAEDARSKTEHKIHASQRLFEKADDIYPVIDTMKYLARGEFTMLDKQKDELLSKLREKRCTRLEDARNEQSTILYSSRDDYPQRDSGFWLFDETGHLPEIVSNEYRCLPMSRLNGNRKNVDFSVNNLPCPNIREKIKNTVDNYIEKDSLEDCTLLEQRRESDTATAFSSSSVENLIQSLDRKWMESLDKKYKINDIDGETSRGRKLVSSRASLDIARHVKAQIAHDRRSNNDKKSVQKIQAHDSDIFAQLSPKIRRKIYHLIQNIVSSGSTKDSAFYQEKYLMSDTLDNEKLQHSKSVDANFVHSNELINNCANNCVSTKLSELLEDENYLCRGQDNLINTCNQNLNNSKYSVKISYENMAISNSSNKFEKTRRLSNNFTRKITRHIIYQDASLKDIVGDNKHTVRNISTIYRKILENSENMDWDSFRKFVEILHPCQKELWRNICKTINEEARRINDTDDNTEVCIEISPSISAENTLKAGEVTEYTREIVFELDMTLKDVEAFLNKKPHPAEQHLDT